MKRISFIGLLVGGAVDYVLSIILLLPLYLYARSTVQVDGLAKEQIRAATSSALSDDYVLYVAGLLLGMAGSACAGYVAGWIARRDEPLNGFFASVPCGLLGVYGIATGENTQPLFAALLTLVAMSASATFGGYLRVVHARARAHAHAELECVLETLNTPVAIRKEREELKKRIRWIRIFFMPGPLLLGLGMFGFFADKSKQVEGIFTPVLSPFLQPSIAVAALVAGSVLGVIEYQKLKPLWALDKALKKRSG